MQLDSSDFGVEVQPDGGEGGSSMVVHSNVRNSNHIPFLLSMEYGK